MSITLPHDYGYVGFSVALVALVQYGLGARAMSLRYYFKSDEWLSNPKVKELQDKHKQAFDGAEINNFGYPDMGHGRYFDIVPYELWVKFNNHQRAHYNMIEQSAPLLACVLFAGVKFPKLAAGFGFLNSVGRLIYAFGYTTKKGNIL